jgi:hypothetical protein
MNRLSTAGGDDSGGVHGEQIQDAYLAVRKPTKRCGYEVVVRKHVLPEFAGSQLAELTGKEASSLSTAKREAWHGIW